MLCRQNQDWALKGTVELRLDAVRAAFEQRCTMSCMLLACHGLWFAERADS